MGEGVCEFGKILLIVDATFVIFLYCLRLQLYQWYCQTS